MRFANFATRRKLNGVLIQSRNSFSSVNDDTMKMITSQYKFNNAGSRDLITLECFCCHKPYSKVKHLVQANIKHKKQWYCSKRCQFSAQLRGKTQPCSHCGSPVYKTPSDTRKNKSNRFFCGQSCAAKYNNTHKTTGTRRAKLERWIEEQLTILYPNLEIKYSFILPNCCELDIYIPSLSLAFELNGIFHYEPIFGIEKLNQIKNRDNRKFKHCLDHGISLCIIDTTKQKRFRPETSQEFLDIILNIIKMATLEVVETSLSNYAPLA